MYMGFRWDQTDKIILNISEEEFAIVRVYQFEVPHFPLECDKGIKWELGHGGGFVLSNITHFI